MPVTASSAVQNGPVQADGSFQAVETHVLSVGSPVVLSYLAAAGTDIAAVAAGRQASINAQLADAEEAGNYDRDGAPSLVELTAAQFAARLRAKYRASNAADTCRLAWWLLRRITAGQITDAQCQSAFGATANQWTNFKTNTLTPQSNAWASVIAAAGS